MCGKMTCKVKHLVSQDHFSAEILYYFILLGLKKQCEIQLKEEMNRIYIYVYIFYSILSILFYSILCIHICIYIEILYIYVYIYIYVINIYIYIYVYIYICYKYIYLYICMCVYVYHENNLPPTLLSPEWLCGNSCNSCQSA